MYPFRGNIWLSGKCVQFILTIGFKNRLQTHWAHLPSFLCYDFHHYILNCVLTHWGWVMLFCISKLVGAQPLSEPMLEYHYFEPLEQTSYIFIKKKCIWKCRLRNGRNFVWPQCVKDSYDKMDELVSEGKQAWYSWSNTVIFVYDQATGIPWTVWKHCVVKYFMTWEWYSFKCTDPFILTTIVNLLYMLHLTHSGLVMPCLHSDKDLHQHWFRLLMASSHYFNQFWLLIYEQFHSEWPSCYFV